MTSVQRKTPTPYALRKSSLKAFKFGDSLVNALIPSSRQLGPIRAFRYISTPLAVWDTWTPIAGPPVAFEPPSAGFALDWRILDAIHRRGVHFATITHAAGISSTGDAELDTRLPFDEPYRISESAAQSIRLARAAGGRLIAIGTTVVRALEHAVSIHGSLRESTGVATNRIGPATELRVVDAILSGTHEPGTSHHQLLSAFVDQRTLDKMDQSLQQHSYRTHEFGDSVFVEKSRDRAADMEPVVFVTGYRHDDVLAKAISV